MNTKRPRSSSPPTSRHGLVIWLSAFTLLAALAGDLLILPATVTLARRLAARARWGR